MVLLQIDNVLLCTFLGNVAGAVGLICRFDRTRLRKETFRCQIHQGVQASRCLLHRGVLLDLFNKFKSIQGQLIIKWNVGYWSYLMNRGSCLRKVWPWGILVNSPGVELLRLFEIRNPFQACLLRPGEVVRWKNLTVKISSKTAIWLTSLLD